MKKKMLGLLLSTAMLATTEAVVAAVDPHPATVVASIAVESNKPSIFFFIPQTLL